MKNNKTVKGEDFGVFVKDLTHKCTINFTKWCQAEDSIERDLGLIAVLLLNGVYYNSVILEKDGKPAEEVVYQFDKKYTEKIHAIEKAYFAQEIQTDKEKLEDAYVFLSNRIFELVTRRV